MCVCVSMCACTYVCTPHTVCLHVCTCAAIMRVTVTYTIGIKLCSEKLQTEES